MSRLESLANSLGSAAATGATLLKCLLRSRRPSAPDARPKRPLVVMGNGPSLRQVLDDQRPALRGCDLMSVNFAANAPEFHEIRPKLYVLADPHFFSGADSDPNVARLWENLSKADWGMILFIPVGQRKAFRQRYAETMKRAGTEVKYFNLTPAEGIRGVRHSLYRRGLAMPRPRNVLIASLMIALREGYREIYAVGADHTWTHSLWVDDLNRVVSVQPHFYKDSPSELDRVASEYAGHHLHDILGSMAVAFRSYFDIQDYALSLGARIVNSTPGSMIDAFPRGELPHYTNSRL